MLENWTGSNADELAALLRAGDAAGFDRALLQYVRARQTPRFFFTPREIPGRVAWIKTHLPEGTNAILDHANAVLKHRFPHDGREPAAFSATW